MITNTAIPRVPYESVIDKCCPRLIPLGEWATKPLSNAFSDSRVLHGSLGRSDKLLKSENIARPFLHRGCFAHPGDSASLGYIGCGKSIYLAKLFCEGHLYCISKDMGCARIRSTKAGPEVPQYWSIAESTHQ
ncbi:hypothetical protein LIA77_04919 [Sarocladium implicatum]|nr:hypothetical protein LIA77_04919 [Sarocladium implicatum]